MAFSLLLMPNPSSIGWSEKAVYKMIVGNVPDNMTREHSIPHRLSEEWW